MATDQILQNLFAKSTQVTVGKKLIKGKRWRLKNLFPLAKFYFKIFCFLFRFGLVHFGSVEDTTEAMENSNGISVNGEVLEVKFHECHSWNRASVDEKNNNFLFHSRNTLHSHLNGVPEESFVGVKKAKGEGKRKEIRFSQKCCLQVLTNIYLLPEKCARLVWGQRN